MALNTTPPPDLKSTDALKGIPDDLLGPVPAELRLGANVLLVQPEPPVVGDVVTICARLRIVREGKEQLNAEGDITHFRGAKLVAAWLKGAPEPPSEDEDQPALFDEGGGPTEDNDGYEESGLDEFAGNPDFSDGGSK